MLVFKQFLAFFKSCCFVWLKQTDTITNKKIWVTLSCGQLSAKSDNIENYEFCVLFSVAES
jgi:hypothetical protein